MRPAGEGGGRRRNASGVGVSVEGELGEWMTGSQDSVGGESSTSTNSQLFAQLQTLSIIQSADSGERTEPIQVWDQVLPSAAITNGDACRECFSEMTHRQV